MNGALPPLDSGPRFVAGGCIRCHEQPAPAGYDCCFACVPQAIQDQVRFEEPQSTETLFDADVAAIEAELRIMVERHGFEGGLVVLTTATKTTATTWGKTPGWRRILHVIRHNVLFDLGRRVWRVDRPL